jgi:hypothetical protein
MSIHLLLVAGAALLSPSTAHAYLNPDQGSMLLQLLLGGVAGAAVIAKIFWRRIVSLFTRRPPTDG